MYYGDRLISGGNEYFVTFLNGRHCVMHEEFDKNEIDFWGTYEQCVEYLHKIREENVDYDLNF